MANKLTEQEKKLDGLELEAKSLTEKVDGAGRKVSDLVTNSENSRDRDL